MPAARSRRSSLVKHLDAAENAVYAVDAEGKLVYLNAATTAWLGLPASELLGQVCRYSSSMEGPPAAVAAAALAPPPAALAGTVCTADVIAPLPTTQDQGANEPPPGDQPQRVGASRSTPSDAASQGAHDTPAPGAASALRFRYFPLAMVEGEASLVMAHSLGPAVPENGDELGGTFDELAVSRMAPVDPLPQELHAQLQRLRRRNLRTSHRQRFAGVSAAITRVRAQIALAATGRTHVLVTGVAGSGRADVAWAIHAASHDAEEALVGVHCADLPAEMALAEIERCWASGPGAPRTLLLHDVDRLALEAQQQLHRMLVERPPALRIVSTARQPLSGSSARDNFHLELALLLSTVVIELPTLASRLEDLPLLAQALLEDANASSAKQIGGIKDETLRLLIGYPWPEDVDELTAAIRHAHDHAQSPLIEPGDLPEIIRMANDFAKRPRRAEETIELESLLQEIELECIHWAMEKARGNKTQAARLLGMNRPKFYRRLEQLNIDQGDDETNGS